MSRFALRIRTFVSTDDARETMEAIGVDPAGITRMVGKSQWLNVLIENVPCASANILKQEMLAIGADAAVARGCVACNRPATDVLLMASLKQFGVLIERLQWQPFGLEHLAGDLRHILAAQDHRADSLHGKDCCLDLKRPQVMAVVNVTPDSFYDGGASYSVADALRQADQQISEGADILDIGGESTRPGAPIVSEETELERVIPVIEALRSRYTIPISVDTNKAAVAAQSIEAGANFINDISGLMFDDQMASVVAKGGAGLFVMHTRGRPEFMQGDTHYDDLMGAIVSSLRISLDRASEAGIMREKLAIDPGVGFGKSVAGNLEILRHLHELKCLGFPILLGTSRKSFIGAVLQQDQPQERLYGSLATVVMGLNNGAQLFRVHDVAATRQVLDMAWAVCGH